MKKIFTLAAFAFSALTFAQDADVPVTTEKTTRHNISVNGTFSDPSQIGLTYEINKKTNASTIVNVSYGMMNYEVDGFDADGTGFVIELGGRSYLGKTLHAGLYYANYLSYGNIKFDENLAFGNFKGTYSYFSFFSPEFGYKIAAGNFTIDPFIGIMWKLEVKGKGDIDNNNVDEWAPRAGIKLGYRF